MREADSFTREEAITSRIRVGRAEEGEPGRQPGSGSRDLVLLTRKSLQIYGKCFADGTDVVAEIYLRSTQPGAVLTSDGDDEEGDGAEPLDGYVNPGEDEEEHEIASATANGDADSDVEPYLAIRGGTAIDGQAGVFVKDGALPAGDGPYGAGDRCLFHGFFSGIG